jgi:diketogulonate reductase-like aldo/keto reductase
LEYRDFGRANVKVSAIGMGTYFDPLALMGANLFGYHRSKEDKIAALRKGLELGINLIDTAEIYGTEPLVAEAMEGRRRDEFFIATKASPHHLGHESLAKAAETSLRRLRCSYIDLYQIHRPNPMVPIKETMDAMEKLVDDGKIKHIGVSNFSLKQTREAEEALSKYELVSNQVEYSLKVRRIEADLLPYCERNNIAVMAYRPIAHGALTRPAGDLRSTVDEISQKYGGKTAAQIALNWLLTKSMMVFPIPRASRPTRVTEDAGAMGWSLEAADMARLEAGIR